MENVFPSVEGNLAQGTSSSPIQNQPKQGFLFENQEHLTEIADCAKRIFNPNTIIDIDPEIESQLEEKIKDITESSKKKGLKISILATLSKIDFTKTAGKKKDKYLGDLKQLKAETELIPLQLKFQSELPAIEEAIQQLRDALSMVKEQFLEMHPHESLEAIDLLSDKMNKLTKKLDDLKNQKMLDLIINFDEKLKGLFSLIEVCEKLLIVLPRKIPIVFKLEQQLDDLKEKTQIYTEIHAWGPIGNKSDLVKERVNYIAGRLRSTLSSINDGYISRTTFISDYDPQSIYAKEISEIDTYVNGLTDKIKGLFSNPRKLTDVDRLDIRSKLDSKGTSLMEQLQTVKQQKEEMVGENPDSVNDRDYQTLVKKEAQLNRLLDELADVITKVTQNVKNKKKHPLSSNWPQDRLESKAATIFAYIILFNDGYLQAKDIATIPGINKDQAEYMLKFLDINQKLPMELSMKIANMAAGLTKESISSEHFEQALKQLIAQGVVSPPKGYAP